MTENDRTSRDDDWISSLRAERQKSERDRMTALILSLFLGPLGVDRFYLGYLGVGMIKAITFGGFGVWWIVDIVLLISGAMKDCDGRRLR